MPSTGPMLAALIASRFPDAGYLGVIAILAVLLALAVLRLRAAERRGRIVFSPRITVDHADLDLRRMATEAETERLRAVERRHRYGGVG